MNDVFNAEPEEESIDSNNLRNCFKLICNHYNVKLKELFYIIY